ncbi:hypothetical protein DXG01_012319 [Tephrocybe rancida]|nr:hypothetical protein DXG01_012319 [Tephrocybe rancida]
MVRICTSKLDIQGKNLGPPSNKPIHLVGIFPPELRSSNSVVRQAAQSCIDFLATLSGRPPVDLPMPRRGRTVSGIYTNPLRALAFMKQMGMNEATPYCASLDPSLVDLNDGLLQLLHEAFALEDAEDAASLGCGSAHQGTLEVVRLRIACTKLLTTSMPLRHFPTSDLNKAKSDKCLSQAASTPHPLRSRMSHMKGFV